MRPSLMPLGPRGRRLKLRALEAFEATSRHLSVTRAAQELGVTQAAVSLYIRYLTQELGQTLIVRSGRSLALTITGKTIASRIQAAFAEIDRSILEATGEQSTTVRLALCSAFAPGWLIKRISAFIERYRDVNLQLFLYARIPELSDIVADAFILPEPEVVGFQATPLVHERLIAIYRPSTSIAVEQLPIIRMLKSNPNATDDWVDFCASTGLDIDRIVSNGIISVSHYFLAFEIAKQGLGIALIPDFLAAEDVAEGRLLPFMEDGLPTGRTYNLFVKESRRTEPALVSVVSWLRSEARANVDMT